MQVTNTTAAVTTDRQSQLSWNCCHNSALNTLGSLFHACGRPDKQLKAGNLNDWIKTQCGKLTLSQSRREVPQLRSQMSDRLQKRDELKKITKPEVSKRKTGGCAKSIDNYCITVLLMIYIRICLLNLLQELYALVAERRNSYYVLLLSLHFQRNSLRAFINSIKVKDVLQWTTLSTVFHSTEFQSFSVSYYEGIKGTQLGVHHFIRVIEN